MHKFGQNIYLQIVVRLRQNIFGKKERFFCLLVLGIFLFVIPATAGEVTITASGDQSYYAGEEITFSGTNTDSETTYLFIIGPNLQAAGSQIQYANPGIHPVTNGVSSTFQMVDVMNDSTWSWKWSTGDKGLEEGTYSIYAVSQPRDLDNLGNVEFGTVAIRLKKPFIEATLFQNGDDFDITGSALGYPSLVQVWVLGENYVDITTVPVGLDGSFRFTIPEETTRNLATGDYYMIVQHPMQNDQFDVIRSGVNPDYVRNVQIGTSGGTDLFPIFGREALKGYDAALAIVQAINDPSVDDTYTKIQFPFKKPVAAMTSSRQNVPEPTPVPSLTLSNNRDSPPILLISGILGVITLAGIGGYYVTRLRKTPSGFSPALPDHNLHASRPAEISNPLPSERKQQDFQIFRNKTGLVFISAKSEDFGYAEQLYDFLSELGYNVFFSNQSLPDKGNSDYRKEIDRALGNARHMIVVTSRQEYVEASWVEAEWGLFINEKRSGRKQGNIITLIAGSMKITDLPGSLRYYEVLPFDPRSFDKILKYLN